MNVCILFPNFFRQKFLRGRFLFFQNFTVGRWGVGMAKKFKDYSGQRFGIDRTVGLLSAHIGAPEIGSNQRPELENR
jgi:hypothetical protein